MKSNSVLPPDPREFCRDRAFFAFGTARIFEKRAQSLLWKRKILTFLGIAVPLLVGGLVIAFGAMPALLPILLFVVGVIGTVQLIVSAWSIVAKWDEMYASAVSSMLASTRLFNAWERLMKLPPTDFEARIAELAREDEWQEAADLAQHVTDAEKRYAMRASLMHRGQACATCTVKPVAMKPTNCDMCGNF